MGGSYKGGAGLTMYKQQFMIWKIKIYENKFIGKVKTVEVELR